MVWLLKKKKIYVNLSKCFLVYSSLVIKKKEYFIISNEEFDAGFAAF